MPNKRSKPVKREADAFLASRLSPEIEEELWRIRNAYQDACMRADELERECTKLRAIVEAANAR
jgi:hypothetical protein